YTFSLSLSLPLTLTHSLSLPLPLFRSSPSVGWKEGVCLGLVNTHLSLLRILTPSITRERERQRGRCRLHWVQAGGFTPFSVCLNTFVVMFECLSWWFEALIKNVLFHAVMLLLLY